MVQGERKCLYSLHLCYYDSWRFEQLFSRKSLSSAMYQWPQWNPFLFHFFLLVFGIIQDVEIDKRFQGRQGTTSRPDGPSSPFIGLQRKQCLFRQRLECWHYHPATCEKPNGNVFIATWLCSFMQSTAQHFMARFVRYNQNCGKWLFDEDSK